MNAMQILLIDADRAIRLLLADCVTEMGYVAIHASNGQEALEYAKNNTVDLILVDELLPDINGYEITRAIRALRQNDWFPIILLTSSEDDETFERCMFSGGDAFLVKPIRKNRLRLQITAMERIYAMRKKLQATQIGLLKANDALRYLSLFDQITGLANRRYFDDTLKREFLLAQREKSALSLIMCDIDCFKRYNDTYGHQAGDHCLHAIASVIASAPKRPTDLACRYGGEEFAVILPKTNASEAQVIAEKMRMLSFERHIEHKASDVAPYVTLSLGIATFQGQFDSQQALINAADAALYRAKANGRNRVEACP